GDAVVLGGTACALGGFCVCFWDARADAARVVLTADGVACESDAASSTTAAPPVATPRAGTALAEAACAPRAVPAGGAGAPTPVAFAGEPVVASTGAIVGGWPLAGRAAGGARGRVDSCGAAGGGRAAGCGEVVCLVTATPCVTTHGYQC